MKRALVLAFAWTLGLCAVVHAEDFYCEVMSVDGVATLSNATVNGKSLEEGDLLKVDDLIEVGAGSYVDVAYDRDWSNVTRIEENSKIRIRSLYPTVVDLEEGGVFAKLKSLPKDSSFDVQTPTAIASVRGTEYRTTFLSGETQIYNVSDSDVYVYGLDQAGQKQEAEPVVLRNSQKTQVIGRGQKPVTPRRMEERELQSVKHFREGIDRKIQENISKGRVGKVQDVKALERYEEAKRRTPQGREEGEGRPQGPKILSGDEAHEKARQMQSGDGPSGQDEEPPQDRETRRNGETSTEGEARQGGERRYENPNVLVSDESGKRSGSLGEPYFPGGERQRPPVAASEEYERRTAEVKGQQQQGSSSGSQQTLPTDPKAREEAYQRRMAQVKGQTQDAQGTQSQNKPFTAKPRTAPKPPPRRT